MKMSDNYGKLLKHLRLKNGDSREILSDKLGFTVSGLRKIEEGERKLKIETLVAVCNLYNTPLTYFFGQSAEIQNTKNSVEWVPVLNAFEEKGITPNDVLSFIQVMEKLRK
jgi:transcriptional regulator with XRE-family HTH domain